MPEEQDSAGLASGFPMFITRYLLNCRRLHKLAQHSMNMLMADRAELEIKNEIPDDHISFEIDRASAAFTHATMEDLLRGFGSVLLPLQGANVLKTIPLAGTSTSGRSEKFTLAELEPFRTSTVDEVIRLSVKNYLSHVTFNNVEDVVNFLRQIEIPTEKYKPVFSAIDKLMKRRHQIVHSVDLSEDTHLPNNPSAEGFYEFLDSMNASLDFGHVLITDQWERLQSLFPTMPREGFRECLKIIKDDSKNKT